MATDRIIVHSSIASAFQATLKKYLSPTHGPSTSTTTVISSTSQSRLQSLVSDALSTGAHLLYGNDDGKTLEDLQGESAGVHFSPVVLGGIKEDMAIWQEEVFGPVVGIMIAQNEDEAVRMTNTTGYGLSAAVFTGDLRKGLALAKRLESGSVLPLQPVPVQAHCFLDRDMPSITNCLSESLVPFISTA